jgi:Coenzyme PQQ synthesis protein D (PqqD)
MAHVHRSLRLAPGVELCRAADLSAAMLRVRAAAKVHLNDHALAILELCDGSRSRDRIVMDALLRSPEGMRPDDVVQFLDAAQSRGWLIEDP